MIETPFWRRPVFILICGAAVVFLSFGVRQTFGLFMRPLSMDLGWGREVLSLAIATQNLIIGAGAPFAGALAARIGAARAIALGGALFAGGTFAMSQSVTPAAMIVSGGFVGGLGLSACGLPLIIGVVGHVAPEGRRSLWMGIVTACATGGQLLIVPFGQLLLSNMHWIASLAVLAVLAAVISPLALSMSTAETNARKTAAGDVGIRQVLGEAVRHRGFLLLTVGFYVCGFQVLFMGAHLPAYIVDSGGSPALGALALMLIGVANMAGSAFAGHLGDRIRKKYLLSGIYVFRTLAILLFISLPFSPAAVILFSVFAGFLWLGTVPLTSGLIGDVFGTRHMPVLYGIVYFSHQMGSFTGVWAGGWLYDATGSYDYVWMAAIGLGMAAALTHLPIDDRPLARRKALAAPPA